LWKLTRPDNRHDKLTRDNLLDLQDHHLVPIESVQEDQRQVWVLTRRGHGEAKKLLEPKSIRVSVLRKQEYDPVTGELVGASYDDHAAAVTSTAAELHRAGIGHRLGFQSEIGHRLAGGYVQRADLVVRAPAAGVPVLLLEVDRRTEDAHDLVAKLRRYWEWGRLLAPDADKHTVDLQPPVCTASTLARFSPYWTSHSGGAGRASSPRRRSASRRSSAAIQPSI
jgi:hypothetical protein